jgi:hypothetical protein
VCEWSQDRLYWALLDAPGVLTRGQLPPALFPSLEDQVPVSADSVHAVCRPVSGGRLAVCAVSLGTLATAVPAGATVLRPGDVPDFLRELCRAEDFNLLVGRFEPAASRLARRNLHLRLCATAAMCALLLERRTSRWMVAADSLSQAAQSLAERVHAGATPESIHDDALRVRELQDTIDRLPKTPDAALTLAAVLLTWPSSVPSSPQSVSVSPEGVSLSVNLTSEPATFLRAFRPPAGWSLDEPRLNSAGDVTRLTLQLRRNPGGASAGGSLE